MLSLSTTHNSYVFPMVFQFNRPWLCHPRGDSYNRLLSSDCKPQHHRDSRSNLDFSVESLSLNTGKWLAKKPLDGWYLWGQFRISSRYRRMTEESNVICSIQLEQTKGETCLPRCEHWSFKHLWKGSLQIWCPLGKTIFLI